MWVRIPLETYIFILNFSLPPRSEQVNGAVANEIKHVHSPEVIVVFRPQIQLIIQGFVYSYLQYSFKERRRNELTTNLKSISSIWRFVEVATNDQKMERQIEIRRFFFLTTFCKAPTLTRRNELSKRHCGIWLP